MTYLGNAYMLDSEPERPGEDIRRVPGRINLHETAETYLGDVRIDTGTPRSALEVCENHVASEQLLTVSS